MAINEEEFQKMQDDYTALLKEVEALKNANKNSPDPGTKDPAPGAGKQTDSTLDDVQKKAREQAEAAAREKALEAAVRFNLGAKSFLEQYKDFLPATCAGILEEVDKKTFSNEEAKARNLQKNLLSAYLSEQENLDMLPDTLKARAMEFKKLADDDKEKAAPNFWDVLKLGVDRKQLLKQAEEAKKANSGQTPRGSSVEEFEAKIFNLGKTK